MLSNKCFIYLTVLFVIVTQIHAACVCNEKGADYCAACSERRVVRPKPKYPDAKIDLPPIGDSCWCSKMMIEPASLPKPCAKHKKPACGCKSSSYLAPPAYHSVPSIFSSSYSSSAYPVPAAKYVPPAVPKDDSLPADPISISLAIQAGKAIEVPEAKLAYGFVQKPIDGLPKVYMSAVPEENLYALKNDVITLKKPLPAPAKKPIEDYPEPEEEESNSGAPEEEAPPSLTYKQLGYGPEQFKNPQFQDIRSSYAYAPSGYAPPAAVPGKYTVDCGYKPGRIAQYGAAKSYPPVDSCHAKY